MVNPEKKGYGQFIWSGSKPVDFVKYAEFWVRKDFEQILPAELNTAVQKP